MMYRSTSVTAYRAIVLVLGVLNVSCAEISADGTKRWTHIDYAGRYAFDGSVLEDKDLSGIACISPTRCLVGADEGGSVQVVELSRADKTLKVLHTVELLSSDAEIDIEGIAAEGDCYYIIGSHGVAKKTGDVQGDRFKLFRLKVDPLTGLPAEGRASLAVTSLSGILRNDPLLGPHFGKPLQQRGVNIEGLAVRNGRLFVGLRNPNLDGYAFVIEVGADEVFAGSGRSQYTLHKLLLGRGLGIREIVAAKEGFLLIAGNAGSEPSAEYLQALDYEKGRGFSMFHWAGRGSQADEIGPIPNTPAKAEAMTILDESDDQVTVLVLYDGVKEGQPSVYRIY
jgi:hypothetical protein